MFLIANLRRMRSLSSASARISSRIAARPAASSGSASREALGGAGRGGVDRRPRGQDQGQRAHASSRSPWSTPQRIPPELLAITPPTQAMSVLAGSGPSLRPCGARTRFAWPSTVPGLTRAQRAVLLDRDAAEVPSHVDQDAVALALAVEAGAAGAEGDRDPLLAAVGEDLGDVGCVVGHHHRAREEPVGAGVGGVLDEVADAGRGRGRRRAAPPARRAAAGRRRRRSRPARGRGRARRPGGRATVGCARAGPWLSPRRVPCPASPGLRPAPAARRRARWRARRGRRRGRRRGGP